ncbi:Cell cycle checkpoint protein rad17 [Physocladia obscura]|uniref:Cell cycle checkpoint protein rad17 n=1 Tax=Physocladia obscura TaxID=109957 RepID=A0AAD5T6S3_9FUNG|nr:Cell cycle checkpoint protein rad17 [Physocladia obscura]
MAMRVTGRETRRRTVAPKLADSEADVERRTPLKSSASKRIPDPAFELVVRCNGSIVSFKSMPKTQKQKLSDANRNDPQRSLSREAGETESGSERKLMLKRVRKRTPDLKLPLAQTLANSQTQSQSKLGNLDTDDIIDDDNSNCDTDAELRSQTIVHESSQPEMSRQQISGHTNKKHIHQRSQQALAMPKKWILGSQSSQSQKSRPPTRIENQLWVDKYTPFTEDELAVNKSKVSDVRNWLNMALELEYSGMRRIHKTHRLLALTGISGSAKTATIRVLSLQLNFEIIEWINPVNDAFENSHEYWDQSSTITQKFTEFVTSARKSNTLNFNNESDDNLVESQRTPKVILVEDIPNLSHAQTRANFHQVLRSHVFSAASVHPIVLILSDCVAGNNGGGEDWKMRLTDKAIHLKTLVPDDIRLSKVKALSSIVSQEFRGLINPNYKRPSKSKIESIANGSGGDIRCALNALQFNTLFDGNIGIKSKSKKNDRSTKNITESRVGRDTSLIFYHALNKNDYLSGLDPHELPDEFPGFDEEQAKNASTAICLPNSLKMHERRPLKSNPEHVFESSHVDSETFVSYLAENYTSTFADIEECAIAANYFSSKSVMSSYSATLSCRATMFARLNPPPPQKFGKNIRKPVGYQVWSETRDNIDSVKEAAAGRWMQDWIRNGCFSSESDKKLLAITSFQISS